MILYCGACNENHDLKPSKVEAIVYALQAAELDALQDRSQDYLDARGRNPDCLIDVADGATDIERYYEHVESFIQTRRYRQHHAAPLGSV